MENKHPPDRVLVIRGGALGDFILTLPVLAALRRHFPRAEVEMLANVNFGALAVAGGLARRVRSLESRSMTGFFARDGFWTPQDADYFASFNLIISYAHDAERIFQSNVARCSGAQFVAGPHRPDENESLHAAQALLRPLETLGVRGEDACPRLVLPGLAERAINHRLAVHPGSGSVHKNWPEPKWAKLLEQMGEETEWHFLLIGGEAEGARCERLAAVLPSQRVRRAQNLPLLELAGAMRSCAAFVGHDSGITHLAAALGLPGIALWGVSNENVWRPVGEHWRLVRDQGGLEALTVFSVLKEVERL